MSPPSTPDQRISAEHYDTLIKVTVGKGRSAKIFNIHRGVLCFYSGFFEAALKGHFREALKRSVTLDTEDRGTFETVCTWMYTRTLSTFIESEEQAKALDFDVLARLWIFGDAHIIPMLQNHVADLIMLRTIKTWILPTNALSIAYESTMPGSPLRRLLIDLVGKTTSKVHDEDQWPREALLDLLPIVWSNKTGRASAKGLRTWDMCRYHVHEKGVRCRNHRDKMDSEQHDVGLTWNTVDFYNAKS